MMSDSIEFWRLSIFRVCSRLTQNVSVFLRTRRSWHVIADVEIVHSGRMVVVVDCFRMQLIHDISMIFICQPVALMVIILFHRVWGGRTAVIRNRCRSVQHICGHLFASEWVGFARIVRTHIPSWYSRRRGLRHGRWSEICGEVIPHVAPC